jgi:hypothetical protein
VSCVGGVVCNLRLKDKYENVKEERLDSESSSKYRAPLTILIKSVSYVSVLSINAELHVVSCV